MIFNAARRLQPIYSHIKKHECFKFVLELFLFSCYNSYVYRNYRDVKSLKNKKTVIALSILTGILVSVFALFSVSAYSENDPLITLSYLKEILFPAFKQEIISEIGTNTAQDNESAFPDESTPAVNTDSAADATYKLLELSAGQTVTANSICEFIVRPGSNVTVISPFPAQGIADITNGIEVLNGERISINAYCLIPRGSDGRGMTVVSEKAYIMIRGDYTIG